jgi:polyhydroxyalkanoate synthesis regulator phasin
MATKKMAEWTDFLGSSKIPTVNDEFNFQTGNSFGLDAFQFDTPDNQGPEDAGRLPTTRGISGLPDGTIPVDREAEISFVDLTDNSMDGLGMDFTAMLSEDEGGLPKDASLVDLQWLDPTQAPELNRLPNNEKTLNSIPSLEEAWGKGDSSIGTKLVPNTDREASQYRASLDAEPVQKKTAEEVKFAVQRALRRAHYGVSLRDIRAEVVATLGNESDRATKAMKLIQDEHGLIGKVFIRASAFPGIKNGKWLDKIRAKAGGARYVITDDQAIATKLGMKMVSEVPWAKALAFYAPRLTAAGYKVASDSSNPREALRRAFRIGPEATPVKESFKPVETHVEASAADAYAALSVPKPEPDKVVTAEDHAAGSKRKAALVQLARWVKEGKLSQPDALRIRDTVGADSYDMLNTATIIITATKGTPVYDGPGAQLSKDAQVIRSQALEGLAAKTAALEAGMMKKAQVQLAHMVKTGRLTIDEARRLAKMSVNSSELQAHMAAAANAAGTLRKTQPESAMVAEYKGTIQKAAVQQKIGDAAHLDPYTERVFKVATEHGIKTGEIFGYLKWARQQMAEGMMGNDLTTFIKARFALPLRKAAKELIREIRAEHEGLSGHLYVDAGAYASKSGTTGCEAGALKHRANGIKYVLAMSKCAGCVFANADGVCQQYNKRLASKPPTKDPKAYQAEAIRLANADDSEVTASMFNPNDFNLRNEPLEDISLDSGKTAEELGEVLFGGMEV